MSDPDNPLNLFLNGFSARDLAEPLASCDDAAPAAALLAAMDTRQVDAIGIRSSGMVAGWVSRTDLAGASDLPASRPFEPTSVVPETAPLSDVVQGLSTQPQLFVRSLGQVSGLIRRCDLEKAPMRMWLFGLVTITELRVTRLIDERFPRGTWQSTVSEGRMEKARELFQERRRRNQNPSLLDCLQFGDKGDIVARDETLRRLTRFPSRRAVESFVKELQHLRNNLAHAQDLSGDWVVILDLAMNLHRVVLGPALGAAVEEPELVP